MKILAQGELLNAYVGTSSFPFCSGLPTPFPPLLHPTRFIWDFRQVKHILSLYLHQLRTEVQSPTLLCASYKLSKAENPFLFI